MHRTKPSSRWHLSPGQQAIRRAADPGAPTPMLVASALRILGAGGWSMFVLELHFDGKGQTEGYRVVQAWPADIPAQTAAVPSRSASRDGRAVDWIDERLLPQLGAILQSGRPGRILHHSAQAGRWLDIQAGPSRDRATPGLLVFCNDVTSRERLVADLHLREQVACKEADRLRRENQMKDDFVHMLVHEIRNPLAPINSAAETLSTFQDGPPVVRQCAQIVRRQIGHLSRLVEDITDLRKIEQGVLAIDPHPVDLAALLTEAIEQVQARIQQKGQHLEIVGPPTPLILRADPRRIVQVMSNLLTNAIRYTPAEGRIQVRLGTSGQVAVISVRDSGIGMSQELIERVFDRYVRGEGAAESAQEGLGIGLTLVRALVGLHHGSVRATSAGPGLGSEFIVELPLPEDTEATTCESGMPAPAPLLLVVDDNRDAADALVLLLELHGFHAMAAYDGPSALALAQQRRPAVCIVDLLMPGMNGIQVEKKLREIPGLSAVTVVALTGLVPSAQPGASTSPGFDYTFRKPIDGAQLIALLSEILHPHRGSGANEGTRALAAGSFF